MTTADDTGRDWLELVLAGEWDADDPQPAPAAAVPDSSSPALTEMQASMLAAERAWEEKRARRAAEWHAPNPVAEADLRQRREDAARRLAAAATAAEAEAQRQAEAEAAAAAEAEDGEDGEDAEPEAELARRPWWSLKPASDAPDASAGAVPAAPAAPAAPTLPSAPGVVRRIAASRWGWLAYHGSAAGIGHSALVGLTGSHLGGAVWLGSAMVAVIPVTTATLACCAGWAGWKLGRALRPYLAYGGLAAPAGLIAGAAWGQGTTDLVKEAYAWAAPWPVLAAPAVIAAAAGTGCWMVLDRRARTHDWPAPLRWAAHIPLATVVLSAALYAPGALL